MKRFLLTLLSMAVLFLQVPAYGQVTSAGTKYVHIATGTTTLVKTGPGTLFHVVVNAPTASTTITLYDNTTASGRC